MRLIEIKRAVNIAKENFEYSTTNSNGVYYIRNIQHLKIAITQLIKVGLLDADTPFFQEVLVTASNVLSSDSDEYNKRVYTLAQIKFLIERVYEWINSYVPYDDDEETTISIKLPDILNLSQFANIGEHLEKSLSYVAYVYGGEPIRVQQVDHGSLWVIISVCSVQIVKALGKVISFAYNIAEKHINLKKSMEELRQSRIQGDMIESFSKMQKMAIDNLLRDAAEEVNKDLIKEEHEAERIAKLELSIRKLTELIVSGTEFYPSIAASQEIIQDFPKLYNNIEAHGLSGLITNEDTAQQ